MDAQTLPPSISSSSSDFPSDVLKWMKANAEAEIALKLMQVCKYFRHKEFPYFVLEGINKNNDGSWNYSRCNDYQITNIQTLDIFTDKKLWILGFVNLYDKVDPFSSFLSKIAFCKAKHLFLGIQNLTINEFKVFTSSGTFEHVNIVNTTITNKNDALASMESILQCMPNISKLYIDEKVPSFSSTFAAASVTVPNMSSFELYLVREVINFDAFVKFIDTHPLVHCRLSYDSRFELSPEYTQQLQQYVDKVIADDSLQYPPPIIHFSGQRSPGVLDNLYALWEKTGNKKL